MDKPLEGKRILVTGGTGSLGKRICWRILSAELGMPAKIIVFSRDEAKQYFMRSEFLNNSGLHFPTDDVKYTDYKRILEFFIGDIRNIHSVVSAMKNIDIVINAAALKQVPACEYAPYEAVKTNIGGAENIVRAIQEYDLSVKTVVAVSTDKACNPVNVMGMTKAIMERVFIQANLRCPDTRFACVRYGNVLASRGSAIPLFHEQIRNGGPVTITTPEMTRFLMNLDQAVDTIFEAIRSAKPGEIIIPVAPSAKIVNVAKALINSREIDIEFIGIRPGEKVHEILISEEEIKRTRKQGNYYVIGPMLPELLDIGSYESDLVEPYSSSLFLLNQEETRQLLVNNHLMYDDVKETSGELLR